MEADNRMKAKFKALLQRGRPPTVAEILGLDLVTVDVQYLVFILDHTD